MSTDRAAELVALLQLQPHPEGGHYREVYRSPAGVTCADGRGLRSAITTIDFLLAHGQFSAWHRVASDEVWHLLEGGPLCLWLMAPRLDRLERIELGVPDGTRTSRHVVAAGWWQAAEPLGDFAYCGATVGPGFEFADFAFLRGQPDTEAALLRLRPDLQRLR